MQRRRRIIAVLSLLLLGFALVPVFQDNLLAPADAYFFSNWDRESQALVLAKIEQDATTGSSTPFGLTNAQPQVLSPYDTFDGLRAGAVPKATSYAPYPSSLGVQGFLFEGLYRAGCSSLTCLNTVESAGFSIVLVLFAALLWLAVSRSLASVVLFSSLFSPWTVSAAHNLYWVPWSWLLPAAAACALTLARTRRWRVVWFVIIGLTTALKASMGYEFLSSTTLLATSIPLLAHVVHGRRVDRQLVRTMAIVFASCVAGFLVVLVIHAFVVGNGSAAAGLQTIAHDALKRTYGSTSLAAPGDGSTVRSLTLSPLAVLSTYLVSWPTSVFAFDIGAAPYPPFALGRSSFWVMVVVAAAIIAVDLIRGNPRWRRNAVVFVATASAPLSWFVLAKSHSATAIGVNYVLWYLIFIPALVWIIGEAAATSTRARRVTNSRT
ncbi:hypothetical protein [uncultured Amnibacterium sp.]|uniref:hypothetical protein n=1 Tax=uncultured Amnibacterium sp. TaxID=1631851 RepID=UPI0035CA52AA